MCNKLMLIVCSGPSAGTCVEIGDEPVSVGRCSASTIVLQDLTVSRRHCQVWFADGGYWVADLGSRNLTWVNGKPVGVSEMTEDDYLDVGSTRLKLVGLAAAARLSVQLSKFGASAEEIRE